MRGRNQRGAGDRERRARGERGTRRRSPDTSRRDGLDFSDAYDELDDPYEDEIDDGSPRGEDPRYGDEFEDDEPEYDEPSDLDRGHDDPYEDEIDDEPAPRRRRQRGGRERRPPGRSSGERTGRRERPAPGLGLDDDPDIYDPRAPAEFDDEAPARPARPTRGKPRRARRRRARLADLCTPVFGYAALLPRGDVVEAEPSYASFREEVLTALKRIEDDAPKHGIELEDAREACYALCAFIDEQVARSSWEGRGTWAQEPLSSQKFDDVHAGDNFFEHLERLGSRQKDVKAVYLTCLAFGFVGRYAELPPDQQATQLSEIRQRILRSIHPKSMEQLEDLFPWAYREARPIEEPGQPIPPWWYAVAGVSVVVLLGVWLLLFWWAGRAPASAETVVEELLDQERPRVQQIDPPPLLPSPGATLGEAVLPETGDGEDAR
jgi:type VI secretion system protein ImpK